jgi:hypothetical protein
MFKNLFTKIKLLGLSQTDILRRLIQTEFNINYINIDINSLPAPERAEFLRQCHEIANSNAFKIIVGEICNDTINSTAKTALNMNHLLCGKMTVFGAELVRSKVEYFASIYETEIQEKETKFDKYSLI